jgi:antitoxin MazE
MIILLKKWGNSLGLRIPFDIAKSLGLKENTKVDLEINNKGIQLTPTSGLEELMAEWPENYSYESYWDKVSPAGKEIL